MMLYQLPDVDIDRFIEEDVPYGDLTTAVLEIGDKPGEITFTARHETTLSGTEEAARILERCGARLTSLTPSGTTVPEGTLFLSAEGSALSLHRGWKVALNMLEYASGIATRTAGIVKSAQSANPAISIATTRKSFPGTKKTAIKAILAGGATPHRLGLSESILVFNQHTEFQGGLDSFLESIPAVKARAPEHKILVEADGPEEALKIAAAGADVVQVDKLSPECLTELVHAIRDIAPGIKISAAGGITPQNAAIYAATGIDIIVLSSVYFGKPADIAARMRHKQP
ncbi:MAG TPA: ModD protein [Chlorobium sp.]|uniref:Putative pyrophosphorylase ModD n=1 Tax=Chlorobium phaeovibrioides (strain DSM 265 / 1930) TaxID=290318 RepID=A4SCC3_CHLPM|nr:ModD protein [Chlorobium sp.]